jgi:hypothetical protein
MSSTEIRDILIECKEAGMLRDGTPIVRGPFSLALSYNTGCQYWEWDVTITAPDGDKLCIVKDEDDYRHHAEWAFGTRSGAWDAALKDTCADLAKQARTIKSDRVALLEAATLAKKQAEEARVAKFTTMFEVKP